MIDDLPPGRQYKTEIDPQIGYFHDGKWVTEKEFYENGFKRMKRSYTECSEVGKNSQGTKKDQGD